MTLFRHARVAPLAFVASFVACGQGTPAPVPPIAGSSSPASSGPPAHATEPPDEAVPSLRTGALAPVDVPGVLDLHVVGRFVGDGYETLAAQVSDLAQLEQVVVTVDAPPGLPAPLSFAFWPPETRWQASNGTGRVVWVRRPVATGPVTGDLFVPAGAPNLDSPGRHLHFRIADAATAKSDPAVKLKWLRALADHLSAGRGAWSAFATARLRSLADAEDPALHKKPSKPQPLPRARIAPTPPSHDELVELMDTTTGATAVQEALQQNRVLFLQQAAREKATVPIDQLKLPPIAHHPWAKMMTHLAPPPVEPLAADAPADFYYVRAASLPSLFHLLDQVDAWGTPAAHVLDERGEERDVAARYEAQLGLRRGPLTRALGPSVLGEVAVVGSDPYVKEGSDVTVLLRVKDRTLFGASLAATLGELEQAHGKLTRETRDHGGVPVSVARSADGAVRQQRATVGDVELVSNSGPALDVVLDTVKGSHPRLADEADFQFMLARDASTHADVLAYLGDRFVAEVVGPRQKVLEARREIALGELMGPGFAALLHGVVQGKSPAKVEDLFATGLLGKDEMTDASGAPIAWQPGAAATSSWGTPAAMTPLIDLPAPSMVTPSEKVSYERFASAYQSRWSRYIDPVALRVAFDEAARTVTADLRQLPLIEQTDYNEAADFVGAARFHARPIDRGARVVIGVGADSSTRRDLSHTLHGFGSHGHDLKLDWIGDWAAVGIADRGSLAQLLAAFDPQLPQRPVADEARHDPPLARLLTLPIYAELAVRSSAQAALALAALRLMANETIPGMFEWGEVDRHRDVPIVQIALKKDLTRELKGDAPEVDVYYAVTQGAFILTLQRWLLERLIDEQLDGTGPTSRDAPDGAAVDSTQLAVEIGSAPGKGLWSCVAWLLEQGVVEAGTARSRSAAEALFHGAPELAGNPAAIRALALAYLGATPTTPDGAAYAFSREGAVDPARGTAYAPIWPDAPVAGSPVAMIMDALTRVRTQEAFDDEGKDDAGKAMRSLHARATFGLR